MALLFYGCKFILPMRIKKIVGILSLIGLVIFPGWIVWLSWPSLQSFFKSQEQQEAEKSKVEFSPVDGAMLLERFETSQQYQPTAEEIEEYSAFENEQIEEAQQWLLDLDAEKRVAGVEQIAAYPSAKAEQLLIETLLKDPSEEVRASAADNLSFVDEPSTAAQDALTRALQDANEDVRNNALNSLQSYVASLDDDNATAKRIVALLKRQLNNSQLSAEMRMEIKDYLSDQFED